MARAARAVRRVSPSRSFGVARSRTPQHARDRHAHLAINAMAAKVARAQAMGWQVTATLRTRPVRKVQGVIELRRVDPHRRLSGADGESNLLVTIAGEEIPLEKIAEIARRREAPDVD